MNLYSFKLKTSAGETLDLSNFKGKAVLIVNIATKCSLRTQFAGLEKLHEDYKDDGLIILGVPCNQFFGQEPNDNKDMSKVCQMNHGVTFQLLEKLKVNGPNTHPLYKWLKKEKRALGFLPTIRWNFEKFLISPDGEVIKRFSPWTKPEKIEPSILNYLK